MTNYITVQTKSNYKNANGRKLKVVQFLGSIISAKVPEYGFDEQGEPKGEFITSDFNLKEIISITSI